MVKNPPANAEDATDVGSISGLGRSPRAGNGNPFQYSCLENSVDRGAWQATFYGVARKLDMTEHTHTHTHTQTHTHMHKVLYNSNTGLYCFLLREAGGVTRRTQGWELGPLDFSPSFRP